MDVMATGAVLLPSVQAQFANICEDSLCSRLIYIAVMMLFRPLQQVAAHHSNMNLIWIPEVLILFIKQGNDALRCACLC